MPTEFVKLAKVGDLKDGDMIAVNHGREQYLLARVGDEYFALDNICSHAYGPLDQGRLFGCEVECPIHSGRFDLRTGEPTEEPAEDPMVAYQVKIEGDDIFIGPPKN
jgi:nitrite reductase/ring-hydroxylating ferredoxin subunit